jgi:hypothetical protein
LLKELSADFKIENTIAGFETLFELNFRLMTKIFRLSLILLSSLLLSGCATIMHGSYQSVHFTTEPQGAKILIDGKDFGRTPQHIWLKRNGKTDRYSPAKSQYKIKFELEGYAPYEATIQRSMDGWCAGNGIFCGFGIIGVIVDIITGAVYRLSHFEVYGKLQPSSAPDYYQPDYYEKKE